MPEVEAHRRLVKSPPELWAELSDVEALARHLGEFGEIRITRTDPETTVAWEGEHARGTVSIESSGWGTKVRLTAEAIRPELPKAEATPVAGQPAPTAPEPEPVVEEPEPVTEEPEPVTEEAETVSEEPALAEPPHPEPVAEPPQPTPVAEIPAPQPPPRKIGFLARLFGRRKRAKPMIAAHEPAPAADPPPDPEPEPVVVQPEPEPVPVPEPVAVQPEPEPLPEPVAVAHEPVRERLEVEPELDPEPALPEVERAVSDERVLEVLTSTLDALGQAHHRPFSRG
jgi:hypothetical protein